MVPFMGQTINSSTLHEQIPRNCCCQVTDVECITCVQRLRAKPACLRAKPACLRATPACLRARPARRGLRAKPAESYGRSLRAKPAGKICGRGLTFQNVKNNALRSHHRSCTGVLGTELQDRQASEVGARDGVRDGRAPTRGVPSPRRC